MANRATRDLKKKLRFEKPFEREVAAGFNLELEIFRSQVIPFGLLTDPVAIRQLWGLILDKQFRRVVPSFSESALVGSDRQRLDQQLARFASQTVLLDSRLIAHTSITNMAIARTSAVSVLNTEGITITRGSLDKTATRILRSMQSPRIPNITVTETQVAAEGSKETTGRVEDKDSKEWVTVRDSKVRPSHILAHGQRQRTIDPFIVGGQKLKYPGDTSLGASIGNVAYCRCAALYS